MATFYILQLVTLETTLRMYWRDPRLRVDHLLNNSSSDYILLHPETSKFIWFPDIYIGKIFSSLKTKKIRLLISNIYCTNLFIFWHFLKFIFQSCLYGINFTDFAKQLRMPTVIVRPASMRIYRNSTVRYATQ